MYSKVSHWMDQCQKIINVYPHRYKRGSMKRLLWWLIAATRGGVNRARIIQMLHERPYNTNQLAEALNLDYKTVQHHLRVLEKNKIIVSSGERYGKMYFLSDAMEENYGLFEYILDRMQGVDV